MKTKQLLLLLLLVLGTTWALNAQETLTVCDGTSSNRYVPFDGYNADSQQHNQMIFPATDLSAMNGKEITQMVFYIDQSANNGPYTSADRLGIWTVSLGETSETTLSGLDNTTSLSQVYQGYFDCSTGTLTLAFDSEYTYHGGNLLVDLNHFYGRYNRWYFFGVTALGASYTYGSQRDFLPKTTFSYEVPVCCPKPKHLTCTGYTANTATFTWTNGGDETSWTLEYGTASDFTGATQQTVTLADLVDGTYTLNGLTDGQTYYARIRAICSTCETTYSYWSNTLEIKPSSVQFTCEDFEDYTGTAYNVAGMVPTAWDVIFTGTNASYSPHVATGIYSNYAIHEGNGFCFTSGSATYGANNYAILPAYEGEIAFIAFRYRYEANQGTLTVGYITNISDASTYTVLETVPISTTLSSSASYALTVPDGARVAFRWSNSSSFYTCGIDDVCVGISPPKPRNLTVSNITSEGAVFSWEAPTTGEPTGYQWQLKQVGEEWTDEWDNALPAYTLSVGITGKVPSTNYDFRVRANYPEGNSEPIEVSFRTLGDRALPYSYGFENNNLATDNWTLYGSTFNSTCIHPEARRSGTYGFEFYYGEQNAYLMSPVFTGATTGLDVAFYYKNRSSSRIEKFQVGYTTDENVTNPADFTYGSEISGRYNWTKYENIFPEGTKRVAIKYVYTFGSYLFLDDFSFAVGLYCQQPQNLECTAFTTTTATLEWTKTGGATDWVLQYSENQTFATGVQTLNVSTNPTTQLTGLTPETTYYARVKPDCDTDGTNWSNTCEFKPTQLICEDFEGVTNPTPDYTRGIDNLPAGWSIIPTTGDCRPRVVSYAANYTPVCWDGNRLALIAGSDANILDAYVILPEFSEGGIIGIRFNAWRQNRIGTLDFGYVTNASDGSSFHSLMTDVNPNPLNSLPLYGSVTMSNTFVEIDIQSIPDGARLAFKWSADDIIWWTVNIDNICVVACPKPHNLTVSEIDAQGAAVSWQAPSSIIPTGYEYQCKTTSTEWTDDWTVAEGFSVTFDTLTANTDYDFRVRATYPEGNSEPAEISFRTCCALPTGLAVSTTPGQGTTATFTWTKGLAEDDDWVLQYSTNADFSSPSSITGGWIVEGNTVSRKVTDLTPETHYYARVRTDCGGSIDNWTEAVEFTPTNYMDYTFNNGTNTTNQLPFYSHFANDGTFGQFIIPASQLEDLTEGTIHQMTFYSSTASFSWSDAEFSVYVKEVERTTFYLSWSAIEDWATMTNVYSGSLSIIDNEMVITFDEPYTYNGGNLMIGFNETTLATNSTTVDWYYGSSFSNAGLYAYFSNYYSIHCTANLPKTTFHYLPTPYKRPVINEEACTFGTTTAHIAWNVPDATLNPTGYDYQYKLATETGWPEDVYTISSSYADLTSLTSGSIYNFRVRAKYEGGNVSTWVEYEFFTECDAIITTFPWTETFESYASGNFWDPCWVNEHISGEGTSIFTVNTSTIGINSSHKLELPNQTEGTQTQLRLPEMNLPSDNYQFVIDIYRNTNTLQDYPYAQEGVYVYVSTDGNIEGATELAFIPRHRGVSNEVIPAEDENGWYTYELPIGISGNCYIILKGVNQSINSIYMDNLFVDQVPVAVGNSWSDDFEDGNNWAFVNGDLTNQWVYGAAAFAGAEAAGHSFYISNDGGTHNAYTTSNSNTYVVYATKLLTFDEAGNYLFDFDWRANGESVYDYLRVALVPSTVELTAGAPPSSFGTVALPTGWMALDGGSRLNLMTSWQTVSNQINVATAGTYRMVFAWLNDTSSGSNPPAAVDNVSITKMVCPVINEEACTFGTTTAHIAWNVPDATLNPTGYDYQYKLATETEWPGDVYTISSNYADLTSLTSCSDYNFRVRANYAGGNVSAWVGYDFLTECPPTPTGLTVSNITLNGATITWTENGEATAWQICLNGDETNLIDVTENLYTFTDLAETTEYTVKVRANCGVGDLSYWSNEIRFITRQVPFGLPYSTDFEASCEWVLRNGNLTNAWTWGEAAHNGEGTHGLYISNDGGTSNTYDNTRGAMVYAYKTFLFDTGIYDFTYDWMANGEKNYDFLRVALVPDSVYLEASNTRPSEFNYNALPNGWIALDGGSQLSKATDWQTMSQTIEIATAGHYNVVFAWRNDNNTGITPPAAIDNVSIIQATCAVLNVVVDDITNHTANVSWKGESTDNFTVSYQTAAYVDGLEEEFSSTSLEGWLFREGALNADGTATLSGTFSWSRSNGNSVFDSHMFMNMFGEVRNFWLITPGMEITSGDVLSIDIAYMPVTNNYPLATGCPNRFAILISTDNMEHWTILREWNNSGSDYVLDEVSQTGENTGDIDLSSYAGTNVYIAFFGHCEPSSYYNDFHFDNVKIGIPIAAGEWNTDNNVEGRTFDLTGLEAGKKYNVKVVANCGPIEGNPVSFTTLEPTTVTQTIELAAGINWVSFYVETNLDDVKAALVAAMPVNGVAIAAQNGGRTTYNGGRWRGALNSLDLSQMYKITVPEACEIAVEGMPIDPAAHPVTIRGGVNWIAFPIMENMTIANAFAGFATNGDQVKSMNDGQATYNGTRWRGALNTLVPGKGYIYNSAVNANRTFVFPSNAKTTKPAVEPTGK